jgi:hypothetical protein
MVAAAMAAGARSLALQETIYSVMEHFRHKLLKIHHKNLSVTFSDSVMY